MIGRPPKPTARHLLDGTYRPDRHGGRNSKLAKELSIGDPMAALSDVEQELWQEVRDLAPWLQPADRMALETYVRLKAIERQDMAKMTGAQLAAMNKLAGALGLNPSERARLDIPVPKVLDEDDRFFEQADTG